MGTKQRYTQAQVIDALKETKGMVYLAAKRLGCEAQTIYNYRDRYPAVRAEMEQQDGEVDDAAALLLTPDAARAALVERGVVYVRVEDAEAVRRGEQGN